MDGTSKAYTVAYVNEGDNGGSFKINQKVRQSPHHPQSRASALSLSLSPRNHLTLRAKKTLPIAFGARAQEDFWTFLGMAKRHPALAKDKGCFKPGHLKALGADWVFEKEGKTHITVDGLLFLYVGSGLELKEVDTQGKFLVLKKDFVRVKEALEAVVDDAATLARLQRGLKRKFTVVVTSSPEDLGLFDEEEEPDEQNDEDEIGEDPKQGVCVLTPEEAKTVAGMGVKAWTVCRPLLEDQQGFQTGAHFARRVFRGSVDKAKDRFKWILKRLPEDQQLKPKPIKPGLSGPSKEAQRKKTNSRVHSKLKVMEAMSMKTEGGGSSVNGSQMTIDHDMMAKVSPDMKAYFQVTMTKEEYDAVTQMNQDIRIKTYQMNQMTLAGVSQAYQMEKTLPGFMQPKVTRSVYRAARERVLENAFGKGKSAPTARNSRSGACFACYPIEPLRDAYMQRLSDPDPKTALGIERVRPRTRAY